ncbi:MAG TPA: helix-turn-helix transcriptional regulator [Anaerovoracaceae bacterium]|nr:helix-turn-helix transcriptional regulator [Anaerovoracaceae bacterium]
MDQQTRKNLARNIICLRHAFGYTQSDVAEMMHMSRSTYALYESDLRIPSVDIVFDLSEIYRVNIDSLIGTETEQLFAQIAQHSDYSTEKKKILTLFDSLSSFSRGCLVERAETLLLLDEIMKRNF